jgi:prepilin-type N-terminal cleavage/methylation domain-containing protein
MRIIPPSHRIVSPSNEGGWVSYSGCRHQGGVTVPKKAFSLVELSIVLVILGLLTGGILTGQSLIRASELRSVTTQVNQYVTAMHTFRDKYFALPGDMRNATSFWGAATGCPNDGTTTGVCNGDGNGLVALGFGTVCENQEMWRHLARAGLIEGSYRTLSNGGCYNSTTLGTHLPSTKLSNVGITMISGSDVVTGGAFPGNFVYTGNYNNTFIIGVNNGVNWLPATIAFATEEAWNIDTKIDDGSPDSGNVRSVLRDIYSPQCATSATPGSADYALNVSGAQCALFIKSGL